MSNPNNPFIQNQRIKTIATPPSRYSQSEVAQMIGAPLESEQGLRGEANALEASAYPYFMLRKTYQDAMAYHWYTFAQHLTEEEATSEAYIREARLVDKVCKAFKPKELAHRIAGQALLEGKVFYTYRVLIDKAHNECGGALAQQLPSDWIKIIGSNSESNRTVSFNMFYFLTPGADWRQYGDLFEPYVYDFAEIFEGTGANRKGRALFGARKVYTEDGRELVPSFERFKSVRTRAKGKPEFYEQNGRWFYWVTLPADKVFCFEIDDAKPAVVPTFTGLMLTMLQIADYEAVQLQVVSNPLVSIVTGEIPYRDTQTAQKQDEYKLSPTGRAYFETLWYQMLAANNTSGVGFFAAPLENMKLQQLAESTSGNEISSNSYAYAIQKSGIGILTASKDPRVGQVQYSAKLAAKYSQTIYYEFERMMDAVFRRLRLKWTWRFKMFGDIFSEKEEFDRCRQGMTLGILPDTMRYMAMRDLTICDDEAMSNAIIGSGLLNKRLPLVTSYSGKVGSLLPPDPDNGAGRPKTEQGDIATEGQEADADAGV